MDTSKMREQFEHHVRKSIWGDDATTEKCHCLTREGEEYRDASVNRDWLVWQAACEALAMDLLLDVERERDELKAENDALRKDLERYRSIRTSIPGNPYRAADLVYSQNAEKLREKGRLGHGPGAELMDKNNIRDISREQFEDWADKNWPGAKRQQLERDEFGAYKNSIYRDFWTGWQASREAVVVELTAEYELPPTMDMQALVTSIRQQDIATIEAQGLRVAP